MQPGYEIAKQAGTSVDAIAQAATLASDEILLDVLREVESFKGQVSSGAQQAQVAEVANVLQQEAERRGLSVSAAKTAADDLLGGSMLHALWIAFKEWLLGHNGYSDYYDGAFASLKPRKEGTVNDDQTFAQREAALLQAMASAPTLERQRELAHDLVTLRHDRTAAAQADRDLDLGSAVVRDTMTPVVTASRHTIATDWMGEDTTVESDEITRTMAAAASRFFLATSADVKADAEEFEIQATGMATAVAGQYGEQAPVAVDAFVRHALFLNREPGEAQRTATLGSNPNVTPLVTKRAADADINPYPANEQAGYAETGLPPTVPTEGYEEKGVVGDYGQEVAPENVAAVEEEGKETPMPGAGDSVPGVTAASKCSNCVNGNHSGTNGTPGCKGGSCSCSCRKNASLRAQASGPVKGIAIYPDKRVEDVTINGLSDGQAIVGGLIQPVTLKDGSTMYVNEEFLYSFGPDDVNWIASDVAGLGGRPEFMLRSPILGPVYIVGPIDGEGYDTDITDTARNWVTRVKREASIKPFASALDAGMRSPAQGFATSILAQGAREDYEHHNEDADRIWWEEEGRHGGDSGTYYCDVCGYDHAGPCPMDFEASKKTAADGPRPIYEIASEIRSDWKNVYFGAVPYLDAMGGLDSINDRYGADDARMILTYFISNASTWRGETAKRVKAEIKAMLGRKASKTAKVSLTNVSFDGGIGSNTAKGTNSSGEVVRFRLSDKDAKDLAFILTGDLAINFSGMDVDESDIITTASKTAGTDPDDQSGEAQSNLPTPEKDTTTAWPWELPEGDVKTGDGAANVAGVPTPGGEKGYPQPKNSSVSVSDPQRLAAFKAAVQTK